MTNLIFIITLITFFISHFFYTRYNLHMFQLNYYKQNEQIKWIGKNIKKLFLKSIFMILVLFLAYDNMVCCCIVVALFLLMSILNKPTKAKKKFVYTNRMKRLIFTNAAITLVVVLLVKSVFGIKYIIAMAVMNLLVPIMILIANDINMPMNKIITMFYIRSAKKKLKEMPDLIIIGVTR